MTFLQWIQAVNTGSTAGLVPFVLAGETLGHVRPGFAAQLLATDARYRGAAVFVMAGNTLGLASKLQQTTLVTRSDVVAEVLVDLRDQGLIEGWRDELFPLTRHYGDAPQLLLERAAVAYFGARGYGVHVNGFVRSDTGLQLWVATRSANKPTWPGALDQIVAGGQPYGLGLMQNVIKECAEEANIDASLAAQARAVGTVSYCMHTDAGIRPDVLFVFDLELPANFVPRNTDGEVAQFACWPIEQVIRELNEGQRFKPNCAVVVIDFLMRHGLIDPEAQDYQALAAGLRGGWPAT